MHGEGIEGTEVLSRVISLCKRGTGQLGYFKGIYDDWTVEWPQDTGVGSVFITDYIFIATLLYKAPRTPPL